MRKPKKSLGQNYLVDKNVLNSIIQTGDVSRNDVVIEIGPGTGNLTELIVSKKPKKIILIEKDQDLTKRLKKKYLNDLEIINKDFMDINDNYFRHEQLIIFGNLPYNVSSQILIKIIGLQFRNFKFKKLILMFQKEVAERIIAQTNSKNYGRISIIAQWKMNIEKIMDINPGCFYPRPKVNSSLLLFTPKKSFYPISNLKSLEHVTQIFFGYKRKMIKKPLNILFRNTEEILKNTNISLIDRPQNITPINYYKLANEFNLNN